MALICLTLKSTDTGVTSILGAYLHILEQTQTFFEFQNGRIGFLWSFQQSNFEVNVNSSKFCGPGNQMIQTQIGRKFRRKKITHSKFYLPICIAIDLAMMSS